MPETNKPILCLDFDGVCHLYVSGWINAWTIPDGPVPGLFDFLEEAIQHYRVAIYSSRSEFSTGREAMEQWFRMEAERHFQGIWDGRNRATTLCTALEYPATKPSAFVSIDDRALTFTGVWPAMEQLKSFKPWNDRLKQRGNVEKATNPVRTADTPDHGTK